MRQNDIGDCRPGLAEGIEPAREGIADAGLDPGFDEAARDADPEPLEIPGERRQVESRGSRPAMTWNTAAASDAVRASGPI